MSTPIKNDSFRFETGLTRNGSTPDIAAIINQIREDKLGSNPRYTPRTDQRTPTLNDPRRLLLLFAEQNQTTPSPTETTPSKTAFTELLFQVDGSEDLDQPMPPPENTPLGKQAPAKPLFDLDD